MSNSEAHSLKKWFAGVASGVSVIMLVQTGMLIYWCGEITKSVQVLERDVARHETNISSLQTRLYRSKD